MVWPTVTWRVSTVWSGLNRFGGNYRRVIQGPQSHYDVDELSRPECVVVVGKRCFQLDCSGSAVHCVVDKGELAGGADAPLGAIRNAGPSDRECIPRVVAANF